VINPAYDALKRGRLAHVDQFYLRADTIAAANALLIAAQSRLPIAQAWGGCRANSRTPMPTAPTRLGRWVPSGGQISGLAVALIVLFGKRLLAIDHVDGELGPWQQERDRVRRLVRGQVPRPWRCRAARQLLKGGRRT
jgi:hypothetical protein